MLRIIYASLIASAGLALVGSAQAEVDHFDHDHRLIKIGNGSVRPSVATIGADDAVGWLNYSDKIARISFAADVAAKMVCKSPSGFRVTGDRLESPDIQARQFATVCSLAKGKYRYRVDLNNGLGSGSGGPGRSFEGELVVE